MEIIEIGKNYEIKGDDFELKIRPVDTVAEANSTYVDFAACEEILRKKNNISDSEILTIMQIEIDSKNERSLVNKVEYAIYNSKKEKMDLSDCSDVKIKVNYEIRDPSIINPSVISSFSKDGIDILNINDSFFTDICYPYSDNSSDITLEDRVKDIYQNFSLCEDGCYYEQSDINMYSIVCNCEIKQNVSSVETSSNFGDMILFTFQSSTFSVIKCTNLVFSLKGIKGNIGFIIFISLIIINFCLLRYYFFQRENTKSFIFLEMK